MKSSFYYIQDGKMYRFNGENSKEISSWVLDSYISKVKSRAEQNEWKYNGQGAAFTGSAMPHASAPEAVSSIFSRVNCLGEYKGNLLYSIDIDSTNGIYRKSAESESEGIVLCSSSTAYRSFDIKGDRLVASAAFAGESHIGVLDLTTGRFDTYTEGHVRDSSPVWSATDSNKIYFCSAGLPENEKTAPDEKSAPRGISQMVDEMYSSSSVTLGPSAICLLDISEGRLDELLSDNGYNFTSPFSAPDGSLYYIRRPYKYNSGGSSFGCLADILMLPVRLFQALFGFLNVFSAKYSGKTLSRSDVKQKSDDQLMIDGNLINAERELKENARRGDKNPGIIPRSWELRRLDKDGNDTLIRSGVAAYKLCTDGSILISNGSHILRVDENGREEKLLAADKVTFIK
ncbi:MAG: hypothetical protein IJW93_00615 [Clostridia bacterium]|nr:hypothetical protein [Clostridia bacterium]